MPNYEQYTSIIKREGEISRVVPVDDISTRISFLKKEIGLNSQRIKKIQKDRPCLFPIKTMVNTLEQLSSYDFQNPRQMIKNYTNLFNHDIPKVMDKAKLNLQEMDFTHWEKIVETFPCIVGKDWEKIKVKFEQLKNLGFNDILKILSPQTSIIGLDIEENVGAKLNQLSDWEVENPALFLEKSPSNISRSIDTMRENYQIVKKICKENNLSIKPLDVIEYTKPILGTQAEKLEIINIILKRYPPEETTANSDIHKLVFANIESIIIAYLSMDPRDNVSKFYFQNYNEFQKEKISEQEKQIKLKEYFKKNKNSLDADTKEIFKFYKKLS